MAFTYSLSVYKYTFEFIYFAQYKFIISVLNIILNLEFILVFLDTPKLFYVHTKLKGKFEKQSMKPVIGTTILHYYNQTTRCLTKYSGYYNNQA